ncbi:MAG: hypothetical protein H7201_07885 [Candidatus Saccharibacteria bacterium]|nr:hypothetical protein [Microbacteriaceae bacterium]
MTVTLLEFDPDAVGVQPSADGDELHAARERANAAIARTESVFFTS